MQDITWQSNHENNCCRCVSATCSMTCFFTDTLASSSQMSLRKRRAQVLTPQPSAGLCCTLQSPGPACPSKSSQVLVFSCLSFSLCIMVANKASPWPFHAFAAERQGLWGFSCRHVACDKVTALHAGRTVLPKFKLVFCTPTAGSSHCSTRKLLLVVQSSCVEISAW